MYNLNNSSVLFLSDVTKTVKGKSQSVVDFKFPIWNIPGSETLTVHDPLTI